MNLQDHIVPEACVVNLRTRTKHETLAAVASALARNSQSAGALGEERIYTSLASREQEGSTGYGNRIAIPHARFPDMNDFVVAFFTTKRGVKFDAVDGKRVHLFAVVLGPSEQNAAYLQLLATISRLLYNRRQVDEVIAAKSRAALVETVLRLGSQLSAQSSSGSSGRQMQLTVHVHDEELLRPILEYLVQVGVDGAAVHEASPMGSYIARIPLYAEFMNFTHSGPAQYRVIEAVVDEERVDAIVQGIELITGDLETNSRAAVIARRIEFMKGSLHTE
jgi:mannitol/fructose-specific phosphotransferase system IIA component (Ntr-type)/PII-like signaling protein